MFRPVPGGPLDADQLSRVIEQANLPTLLMVLYQLTGDAKWLRDPYRPTRNRGLDPHDSGGFPEDVASDIRETAIESVTAWWHGKAPAIPNPSEAQLSAMLDASMAEPVPHEYLAMAASELDPPAKSSVAAPTNAEEMSAVIVGAGVSGLLAALRLREVNVSYVVLEKNPDIGGTWWENRYPGAGVDTPSYLYSYSFYHRHWTTHYAKQPEVEQYLQDLVTDFDLRGDIEFNTEVTRAVFDADAQEWLVTSRDGAGNVRERRAQLVISAVGFLNRPFVPDLPGVDRFSGRVFHSAAWPDDVDLHGKRVALVGTGASAVQIAPTAASQAQQLTIFQRTPQWIVPAANYFAPVADETHWLMANVPFYYFWYRLRLAWIFNDRVHASLRKDPTWPDPAHALNETNDGHRRAFTRHALEQLAGRPDLQAQVVPSYPPFGKRMLLDNHWYDTLRAPNVELVPERVIGFTERGVKTSADRHFAVDAVVLATGFRAQQYLYPIEVVGRDRRVLADVWDNDDARAYLGITVPGFPNLFILYGPNTNAAGGSYTFIAECQMHYVLELIRLMRATNAGALEPKQAVFDAYNEKVDAAHENMIWTHPGMETYYRNARGRVVTNSPWRVVEYWSLTRSVNPDDYCLESRAPAASMRREDRHAGL